MNRRIIAIAVAAAAVVAACSEGPRISDPTRAAGAAAFAKGGNSEAAHACQQGGWQHLMGSDGTLFQSVGECVSYAAHGGTLVPIPATPPTITSFTFSFVDNCDPNTGAGTVTAVATAVFSGGTGILTVPSGASQPVTSGVAVPVGIEPGTFTLTVSNSSGSVSQSQSPFGSAGPTCSAPANRRPGAPAKFRP